MKRTILLVIVPVGLFLCSVYAAQSKPNPAPVPTLQLLAGIHIPGTLRLEGPSAVTDKRDAGIRAGSPVRARYRKVQNNGHQRQHCLAHFRETKRIDVYVTDAVGVLRVYDEKRGFSLLNEAQLSAYGITDSAPANNSLVLSKGQCSMGADQNVICQSQIGSGDETLILDGESFAAIATIGETLNVGYTTAYDWSGNLLWRVPNPVDMEGASNAVVRVQKGLVLLTSGTLSFGVWIYQAANGDLLSWIPWQNVNAMTLLRNGMVAVGTELGGVAVFDISDPAAPQLISNINLRAETGYNGADSIEIRSICEDPRNGRIYAGSSWSDPAAPSFFVLQLKDIPSSDRNRRLNPHKR